jgi:hypothetical protein
MTEVQNSFPYCKSYKNDVYSSIINSDGHLEQCSLFLSKGYTRGQGSSLSPRGYGSNGSTPHSNGSGYSSAAMNGYHAPAGGLGNMGNCFLFECRLTDRTKTARHPKSQI